MALKQVKVVAAIVVQQGRVLATQRGYGDHENWWEFPGGKVEPGYPTFHLSTCCHLYSRRPDAASRRHAPRFSPQVRGA